MKAVVYRYYETLYGSEIRSAISANRHFSASIVILREYDSRRTLRYAKKARLFFKKYFNYEPSVEDESIFVDTLCQLYDHCIKVSSNPVGSV